MSICSQIAGKGTDAGLGKGTETLDRAMLSSGVSPSTVDTATSAMVRGDGDPDGVPQRILQLYGHLIFWTM